MTIDRKTKITEQHYLQAMAFGLQLFAQSKYRMKREKVESSVLKSVGYDKERKIFETELVNETIYEYYRVPFSEYTHLIKSSSLGEYYNKQIKKYRYKKLK